MPSDNGAAWCPPAGSGERRLSNSSDGSAGSGYSKALPSDTSDYLQLRSKLVGGKPAANPLQFVKVGPCELYRSAQQQLRKAEEVKKNKEVKKEELEDWQSNLDNWKSSRRKRVEHIIERCVEVKRMENEPSARAKGKTFNEMLEERAGKRRRCPMALYPEEENTDLSDLGIGTSSTKSSLSEDCDTHSLASDGIDLDKNHSDVDNLSNCGSGNRKLGSSANEYDTCTTTTISSPEPEEYTYEGAIEGYKSRMNSDYKNYGYDKEKTPDKVTNGDINRIRTTVSNKIEEKVSSLQTKADVKTNQKKDIPKVDILKRREQFEKDNSSDNNGKTKLPELANKKSIKERLSNLEKFTEEQSKCSTDLSKQIPAEVVPLKDRLSSLEKIKSAVPGTDKSKIRLLNGDISNTKSVKERLSSLKSQTSEEEIKVGKPEINEVSVSLKERLSSLDSAKNKEIQKQIDLITDTKEEESKEKSLKTSLSGLENQMQNFCRSLDSMDINGSPSPSSFERVQSLEDLGSSNEGRNNTSPSDVETEDSGIQTGRSHDDSILDHEELEHNQSNFTEISEVKDYLVCEDNEEQDISKADTDSTSNYLQAVSHPNEDLSATDEITEIQLDKDDEDTLKSLDPQDTSVIDALELAFQEIDIDHKDEKENDESETINTNNKTNNTRESNEFIKKLVETKVDEIKLTTKLNANHSDEAKETEKKVVMKPEAKIPSQDYENIEIFYENGGILDNIDASDVFPLDLPKKFLEPPKEKPPPPPMEDCVEDDVPLGNGNFKSTNSTRRIKKEIRNKRTSFLGLEGQVEDYLDVSLAPVPDITSFLQEETKIEKLLYKNSTVDSRLRESRDSGVDLDKPSMEYAKSSPETSNQHSRQNSEPYTQVTVTSDEEDSRKPQAKDKEFKQHLTSKLQHLQTPEKNRIDSLDEQLQKQQEVLRFERELLQLEQEELRRQRDNLLLRENQTRRMQKSVQDINNIPVENPRRADHRHSMPNLLLNQDIDFVQFDDDQSRHRIDTQKFPIRYSEQPFESSQSDSSRQTDRSRHFESARQGDRSRVNGIDSPKRQIAREVLNVRQPMPLPPKPRSKESLEREITMRSSRMPSAVEYVNIEKPVQPRPKPIVNGHVPVGLAAGGQVPGNAAVNNGQYHPMTRHTLQALSAAPTPKLISGADWLQARSRRQIPPSFNYSQHWLIQEAEQRRIEEERNRRAPSTHRHSYHDSSPLRHHQAFSSSQPQLPQEPQHLEPRDQHGETMLSVSGRKKCSHCGQELGRGAAMIIESLSLCYHVWCFSCVVCGARLGDGRAGADVRVRARRLHCHQCYSSDDGSKFSCV